MIKFKIIKRVAILVLGGTVFLLGIALLVLPGPAFIVIPAGLAILAMEFAWARRWLRKARGLLPNKNGSRIFFPFTALSRQEFSRVGISTSARTQQQTDRMKGQKQ